MTQILVTGGAGYIGSHMVKLLADAGFSVVTLDNLSTGHQSAVSAGDFVLGSVGNSKLLDNLFSRYSFDAVMHFASYTQVAESVIKPNLYYQNNVCDTLTLLDAMHRYDVDKLIFSSSAAIFGEPEYLPIDELHPKNPINPYGRTKQMVETLLSDFDAAYGLRSISLRYFNAAGAHPDGSLGENHDPESHLIPLVLQAASGRRSSISVFGRDYETPQGTGIRDYIHVCDLCDAHMLALQALMDDTQSQTFNLGNGNGYSVQQVIDTAKKVTGRPIHVVDREHRNGDPAALVASSDKIRLELGWQPKYPELESMIKHAWAWELRIGKRQV